MKILAISSSSKIASVSVLEDGLIIAEHTINSDKTHSVILMPILNDLLNSINLSLQDIDVFACDIGPGSFTGLRIRNI